MKQSTQNPTPESVRILRSATCPSLSGKSILSYQVGCTDDSQIQLRIVANSAAGSFIKDWIDLNAIKSTLEKAPRGAPITSNALRPIFIGRSANCQLFLFAVLVHEGFVRRLEGEKRGYERVEVGEFVKRTQALMAGKGATTAADTKKKQGESKASTKARKRTASTKSKKSPS